jgi:hypothetical protein
MDCGRAVGENDRQDQSTKKLLIKGKLANAEPVFPFPQNLLFNPLESSPPAPFHAGGMG